MPTVLKNEEWMSVSEAAEYLDLSVGRIRQLLIADRIKAIKLNQRAWAIAKSDLDEFIKLERPVGNPNFKK